jgi:hypothetical protein
MYLSKKGIPSKLWEPTFFYIGSLPQRRRLTISNDNFDWSLLISFFNDIRISLSVQPQVIVQKGPT